MAENRRVQVDPNQIRRGSYGTFATPVNTVATPRGPELNNEYTQLAAALQQIKTPAMAYLEKQTQRMEEETAKEATRAAAAGEDAPEDASTFYLNRYNEQKGRAEGLRYNVELNKAYAEQGIGNSDDPEVYREFVQEFRQEYLSQYEDRSPEFQNAMTVAISQIEDSFGRVHASRMASNVVEGYRNSFEQEAVYTVEALAQQGASPEEIGAAMNALKERSMDVLGPSETNKLLTAVLATVADESGDTDVLDALDHIKTGTGVLGGTTAAVKVRSQVSDAILARQMRQENLLYTRQQRARAERERQASIAINRSLLENHGEIDYDLLEQFADVPAVTRSAFALSSAMKAADQNFTPEQSAEGWRQFYENPTYETVALLAEQGMVSNAMVNQMSGYVEREQEWNTPEYRRAIRNVEQQLTGPGGYPPEEYAPALNLLTVDWVEWLATEEGQQANPAERIRRLNALTQEAITTVTQKNGLSPAQERRLLPSTTDPNATPEPTLETSTVPESDTEASQNANIDGSAGEPVWKSSVLHMEPEEFDKQVEEFLKGEDNRVARAIEFYGLTTNEEVVAFIQAQRNLIMNRSQNGQP